MSAPITPPPNTPPPIVPMSEFMTSMYQDIMINEYNNPEPGSAAQKPDRNQKNLLELAKEVKVVVEMLVEVIKKGQAEKDSSMEVDAYFAKLREVGDRLVEVVAGAEGGDIGKAGSAEAEEQLGDLSEGQGKSEEVHACDQAGQ